MSAPKELTAFAKCEHKRLDSSWSHGCLPRCLDCGAIHDDLEDGWDDVVEKLAIVVIAKKKGMVIPEAVRNVTAHLKKFVELAEQQEGIRYSAAIDQRSKELEENSEQLKLPL